MRRIEIYDTTLRDGSQGEGVSFSLQDKLLIARRLDALGFDYVEGGYPLSNEKDVEFFAQLRQQPLRRARATAFGMTRRRDLSADDDPGMQALVKAGAPTVTVVGKTSAFHVSDVLRVSLEDNLAMIADSIGYLVAAGKEVIYDAEHFFDGWKLDPGYALQTIQAAARRRCSAGRALRHQWGQHAGRNRPPDASGHGRHRGLGRYTLSQRLRFSRRQHIGGGGCRSHPGPRNDQWNWRTLRQRGPDLRDCQFGA